MQMQGGRGIVFDKAESWLFYKIKHTSTILFNLFINKVTWEMLKLELQRFKLFS